MISIPSNLLNQFVTSHRYGFQVDNKKVVLIMTHNTTSLPLTLISKLLFVLFVAFLLLSCGGGSTSGVKTPVEAKAGADRIGAAAKNFDQVDVGDIVFLNGLGSSATEWHWRVIAQSVAGLTRLTSENTQVTGFYAEKAGVYTIQLTVASGGSTSSDTLIITLIDDLDWDGLDDINDPDLDGDGFTNDDDAFPKNREAHYDDNSDGISNYATSDVDADGVLDYEDAFPRDFSKTSYASFTENRENGLSNQNDGISVSEVVGNVPAIINGIINATDNRPDIDYYQISFANEGRFSAVLTGADSSMRPSIAIINNVGANTETTTANMPWSAGTTAISSFIPAAGSYYLSVTDSSGKSNPGWNYAINIFPDGDLDGVPDDLERAIESNQFTADSDGDGISDFVEVQYALINWNENHDSDNDGLPLWWDLDSDGDGIPDSGEYFTKSDRPALTDVQLAAMNDADGDGVDNFLDSDSDNNTIADKDEAGVNTTDPTDLDQDGSPDFLDIDDDNDSLLDINEEGTQRLIAMNSAANKNEHLAMSLISLDNQTTEVEEIVRAGDQTVLIGTNLPDDIAESWIMIRGVTDALNLRATSIDEQGIHFQWPAGISSGLVELYLTNKDERSNAVQVQVVNSNTPVLMRYDFNAAQGKITFFGQNLNASLSINFSGGSVTVANSSGDAESVTLSVPFSAESGLVSISSVGGESNAIWVTIMRNISGKIEMPENTSINVNELDVAWDVDEQIIPDINGNFTSHVNLSGQSIITAVYEDPLSTDEEPMLAAYMMGLALENDNFILINSQTTALALLWSAINPPALVAEESLSDVRDTLAGLPEVEAYGDILEIKLGADSGVLLNPDGELQSANATAILAAIEAIQAGIEDNTFNDFQGSLLKPRAVERKPAAILPKEPVDDIQIKEREKTGNLDLTNDTNMFLSAQMTALSGKPIMPHTTAFWDLIAPQGYGVAAASTITPFSQPNGRSVIVQVVTPGTDKEFEPKIEAPYEVWQPIMSRTVVQQVFWPAFQIAIGAKMDPKAVTDIFLEHVFSVSEVSIKLRRGQTKEAMLQIIDILKEDFLKQPPGSGPVSKALVTYLAKKYGKKFLIKKLGRMLAIKIIPIFGQIETAVNVAGHIQNATGTIKAVVDLATTDAVIEYEVNFPPEIDELISGAIRPTGKAHSFIITGRGFSLIKKILAPGVTVYAVPKVTFSDANGRSEIVYPDMGEVERHDEKMTVRLSGAFLDPDKLEGPIKVKVHHPEYTPDAFVIKDPAIEVIDQIKITSVVPDKVHKSGRAVVFGAGFSNVISNNEVMVGNRSALISFATESMLEIVIPFSLEPGEYLVKARSMWNIEWSDWSNELPIEIIEGEAKITVSDNGGIKDDAFALYVNGRYIDTMYASPGAYSKTYSLDLSAGPHTAMLLGVEAPDAIGTYGITFVGVEDLAGDATSGDDLVPGVRKHFNFSISSGLSQKPSIRLKALPFHSRVPDLELMRARDR